MLRRDQNDLTSEELQALQESYPGRELEFLRTDPSDWREHLALCMERKPDVVVLPLEKPIPSAAMDEGFAHVVLGSPDGKIKELLPLKPSFKDFVPKL